MLHCSIFRVGAGVEFFGLAIGTPDGANGKMLERVGRIDQMFARDWW
jgi:hypothetical protein